MSQEKLDVTGVAYICTSGNHHEFIGVLVTKDKAQYNLVGRVHACSPDTVEDVDHHTCCFDDFCQMLDLVVTKVNSDDFDDHFVVPHVMKTAEDNFTLTSKHVAFVTDELLVGEEAEKIAVNYISDKLAGRNCLVCMGEMKIEYPIET